MTKLEKDIFMAISAQPFYTNVGRARIAAKIAIELAREAYRQGSSDSADYHAGGRAGTFREFIREYEAE